MSVSHMQGLPKVQYKHAVQVEYGNKKDSMVDKTQAMLKWTEKATKAMERNADCN